MKKFHIQSETARLWSFLIIGFLFFSVLGIRLFVLQVLQWPEYREKSDNNRFRIVEIVPPRGVMKDRKGRLMVTNRPTYSCYGVPNELWRDKAGMALLDQALHMPSGYLEDEVIKPFRRTFAPMRLKRDLSFSELSAYEELRDQIPGAFLQVEQKRSYAGTLCAHALGYVAEVSPDELDKFPGVTTGDLIGKRGLERVYDSELRGVKGRRFAVVNAFGQEVGEMETAKRIEPVPGNELWLSLDLELQQMAESLLVDKIGAVVAMDVRTGGVLCMASAPTYDPEIFAGRVDMTDWNRLMEDPKKPMLNRVIQAVYPPGSTIKLAMLTEGLESGTIDDHYSSSCPGSFTYGNRTFKCWKKGGHGRVVPLRAVESSCDVFFYRLGLLLGVDGVHHALARYHLGQASGVDLTSESDGIIPSEAYYNRRYGPNGWTRGFIPSISIGQGEVTVTPMQMCAYVAGVADGKVWHKPHLVEGIFDPQTRTLKKREKPEVEPLNASAATMDEVREGARLVVWGDNGTARAQRDDVVKIAGKTGTAQNPHGDDHAWFIGYAPVENPVIAICVLVEFGMHGSSMAAPIAKDIMKKFVIMDREESRETALNGTTGQP